MAVETAPVIGCEQEEEKIGQSFWEVQYLSSCLEVTSCKNVPVVNRGMRKLVIPFGKSNISLVWRWHLARMLQLWTGKWENWSILLESPTYLLSGGDILQECSSCEQGNEKIGQSFWKVQYISCLEVTSCKKPCKFHAWYNRTLPIFFNFLIFFIHVIIHTIYKILNTSLNILLSLNCTDLPVT